MATVQPGIENAEIENVELAQSELWKDGPPYELFKEMRGKCPVHWSEQDRPVPRRGRLLVGDHGRGRAHRQPRLGDLLLRARWRDRVRRDLPARARAGDVHRPGPAQARPRQGAVPAWLHAEADRRPRGAHPRDHVRRARPARGARALRPGLRRGPAGRLAGDLELHGPVRGRRRDLGADHERGAGARRPRAGARRHRRRAREGLPGDVRALPRADRRTPREPHRRPHERPRARRSRRRETRGDRDRDGLLPADGGRERLDQGDLLQRDAGADGKPGAAARAGSRTPR